MDRIILHSDLNCFYASVEMMLCPALRGKAVAVCGSTEDRHGIVLAKSELAKAAGVKTGMVIWEARQKCPDLTVVPPRYDQYLKYSALTRDIYLRYTDLVEPFGMDECWLDVTGCGGSGLEIAEKIRRAVKAELGLTVSIGVSFNKVFAKLGSDMKKPDAVTEIRREDYREKVWPLPIRELLYVGRATERKLAHYGIRTIGDIAAASPEFLQRQLGVNGLSLWRFARGADSSPVKHAEMQTPIKSIGRGITCTADLTDSEEVWRVMLELTQDIGHQLRIHGFAAAGVAVSVKSSDLAVRQFQSPLACPTRSPTEIARKARNLFDANYGWSLPVRSVSVRVYDLLPHGTPLQTSIFYDAHRLLQRERLDDTVEDIRRRFGRAAIGSAACMGDLKIPGLDVHELLLPSAMHR